MSDVTETRIQSHTPGECPVAGGGCGMLHDERPSVIPPLTVEQARMIARQIGLPTDAGVATYIRGIANLADIERGISPLEATS